MKRTCATCEIRPENNLSKHMFAALMNRKERTPFITKNQPWVVIGFPEGWNLHLR